MPILVLVFSYILNVNVLIFQSLQTVVNVVKPGHPLHRNLEAILQKIPTEMRDRMSRRNNQEEGSSANIPSEKTLVRLHKQVCRLSHELFYILVVHCVGQKLLCRFNWGLFVLSNLATSPSIPPINNLKLTLFPSPQPVHFTLT